MRMGPFQCVMSLPHGGGRIVIGLEVVDQDKDYIEKNSIDVEESFSNMEEEEMQATRERHEQEVKLILLWNLKLLANQSFNGI